MAVGIGHRCLFGGCSVGLSKTSLVGYDIAVTSAPVIGASKIDKVEDNA